MKMTWPTRSVNSSNRNGVVHGRGEPETVLDQRVLPGTVTLVLAVELGTATWDSSRIVRKSDGK